MGNIQEIEKSIIKRYRKYTWGGFIAAVKEYSLINTGDRVLVNVKNAQSLLLAKCLQELKKHGKKPFETVFCTSVVCADRLLYVLNDECHRLSPSADIDLAVVDFAKENNCNIIADSAYFEQAAAEILKNLLFCGKIKAVMPKEEKGGIAFIKPFINVSIKGINIWSKNAQVFDLVEDSQTDYDSLRAREIISKFPDEKLTELNLLSSVKNVNLETVISYIDGEKKIHFLDDYGKQV